MGALVIPDRGPSPYFRGRKEILQTFTDYLCYFKKEKTGTIFLIQGAQGSGKTALIDQCEKIAQKQDWETVEIDAPALWDSNILCDAFSNRNILKMINWKVKFGYKDIVSAEAGVNKSLRSIQKILQSGKRPLLLILDEAQSLGKPDILPSTRRGTAGSILNQIHNGKLRRPVVLLAAGLGTTDLAFKSLGISRFEKKCLVQLGLLDKESERAVIHDWLMDCAQAEGDPTKWIDAIAQKTHGWPQHIISYVDPASQYIKSNNRQMTDEGLQFVLEKGEEFRQQYYQQRAKGIDEDKRRSLARAISDVPFGETSTRPAIMSELIGSGLTHDEADDLFNQALEQGVIDERDGCYGIPIPSMQSWLLSEYGRDRSDIPREDVQDWAKESSRDDGEVLPKYGQER